ncbi:MAG: hypothetical protein HYW26_01700 [Candidatus Aenigmarchaeota archaeon]|nr:hypothetical protein [Candidatus Aenigmarchaeota archaeon]
MPRCIIIRFRTNSDRFDSVYERAKFFKELHGWKQTVPGENKKYVYHRAGLLDEVPHMKVADSVFIVAMEHMKQVEQFFDEWDEKVEYDTIEVMMKDFDKLMTHFMRRSGLG